MSINKVCISGNLTRDAEVRVTQGGTNVIAFGVAVSDRRQNPQTQQWEDVPNYVDCVLFDRNGNRQWIASALRKGFKVFVEGSLRYSSWTDGDTGKKRSKLEVVVREIDASWPRREQAPQQGYQPPQGYQYAQPAPQQAPAGYPQQPQGYAQPAQAPQRQPPANYPPQQGYAPQQPPQPPTAPQQPAPQQMQMPAQPVTAQPVVDVYDEDIPF